MKNRYIKVGTAVPSLKVADVAYNTGRIIELMNENRDCGLLVFPELSLCGYTCADLFGHRILLEECEEALGRIAEETKHLPGMTVCIGIPAAYRNCLYNCCAYVSEGIIAGLVPKTFLPTYSEFYEGRWFASGKNIVNAMISIAGQKVPFGVDVLAEDEESGAVIGADICEDLWVPDKPSTHACLAGANIIVNLSASDEIIGKQNFRRMMIEQQSASCYCAYLYVSSGMDESSTDLVFSGHSVIAENGRILKDAVFPERPCVETCLIDLETIMFNRRHQSTYATEGEENYRRVHAAVSPVSGKRTMTVSEMTEVLKAENHPVAKNPFVPADDAERGRRCARILEIQAHGLATRVRSTGIKNLIIGISGGLDSTLALIVCHEARKIEPSIHIIAYTLPNRGNTTSLTYNNAVALMKAMAQDIREVAIEDGVRSHLIDIGHGAEYQGEGDTTYENAQARMRTYILMDAANMLNGLVVGTGDLSELALGWCTYNGDHMSMYAVNASVPKTLVQYICKAYADTCGDENLHDILYSIIDTPISPELTPSENGKIAQKTEEKIGKYDLNDFFLFYVLRYGFDPEKIMALALRAYDYLEIEEVRSAMLRFCGRFFHQQFKRSCLPDGPKVGSVTLSPRGDWRMPSDASVNLWLSKVRSAE